MPGITSIYSSSINFDSLSYTSIVWVYALAYKPILFFLRCSLAFAQPTLIRLSFTHYCLTFSPICIRYVFFFKLELYQQQFFCHFSLPSKPLASSSILAPHFVYGRRHYKLPLCSLSTLNETKRSEPASARLLLSIYLSTSSVKSVEKLCSEKFLSESLIHTRAALVPSARFRRTRVHSLFRFVPLCIYIYLCARSFSLFTCRDFTPRAACDSQILFDRGNSLAAPVCSMRAFVQDFFGRSVCM